MQFFGFYWSNKNSDIFATCFRVAIKYLYFMEKTKLKQMRLFKGFSQQQIADQLCMGTTTYHRRENGQIEINIDE